MTGRPDRAWVDETVRRTRAAQGLPPTVEDPAALRQAADLLRPLLTGRKAA